MSLDSILISTYLILIVGFLKFLDYPYPLIIFLTVFIIVRLYSKTKKLKLQISLIYLATIVFTLGCFESYLVVKNIQFRSSREYEYSDDYNLPDQIRETAPKKDTIYTVSKTMGDIKVWDQVSYTIDKWGLRLTPKTNPDAPTTVVFFGGSYTFGDGLMDEETLPYEFEQLGKGEYYTLNFGYSGHSAWHMNRIVRSEYFGNMLDDIKPDIAVYMGIPAHVSRDYYKIRLEYPWLKRMFHFISMKSLIVRTIYDVEQQPENIQEHINTIVDTRNRLFKKYGTKFYVLYWSDKGRSRKGEANPNQEIVLSYLRDKGIEAFGVESDIFSMYPDPLNYYHIPNEGHPTALANEHIAKFLLEKLRNNRR